MSSRAIFSQTANDTIVVSETTTAFHARQFALHRENPPLFLKSGQAKDFSPSYSAELFYIICIIRRKEYRLRSLIITDETIKAPTRRRASFPFNPVNATAAYLTMPYPSPRARSLDQVY